MTVISIAIKADMRAAAKAPQGFERIAAAVEAALRELDASHPTVGRVDPAVVTHCFVKTEHGLMLGRAGRGEGWHA